MSKYTVHRTYLIRRVETWTVETDADLLDMDFGDADELVCDTGELLSADYEIADEDELSVEILPDESDAPMLDELERQAWNVAHHEPTD